MAPGLRFSQPSTAEPGRSGSCPYSDIKALARALLDLGYNVSINDYQHVEEELGEPDPEKDP